MGINGKGFFSIKEDVERRSAKVEKYLKGLDCVHF